MTREEAKTVFLNRGYVEVEGGTIYDADKWRESCRVISEWLEQEPSRDIEEIEEVISCDVDAETKCKMISNILTAKPHYFEGQEPIVTSTNNSGEMIYSQVEGITPTVVESIPNIDKKVESYKKLLKHPVVKHIMDLDETQEQIDFVQPHKKVPVTLTVESGDYISRQDAINSNCYNCSIKTNGGKCSKCDVVKTIEKLPSFIPQSCKVEETKLQQAYDKGFEDCRQMVLDKIKEVCFNIEQKWVNFRVSQGSNGQRDFLIDYIEKLSPINPKPTGHWIKDKEPWGGMQGWKCDKCNHTYDINVVYSKMPYNFCPNCGARMEEV